MMDLYDIYDPGLLDLARAARERGWWRAYGVEDRGYVDLETEACAVREATPVFDQLLAEALPDRCSRELIEQAAREL